MIPQSQRRKMSAVEVEHDNIGRETCLCGVDRNAGVVASVYFAPKKNDVTLIVEYYNCAASERPDFR